MMKIRPEEKNLMMFRKTGFWLVIVIVQLSCQSVRKQKELKLAHTLNTEHPVHKAIMFMADRVDELSEGKLKISVYPSGQLGSEQQNVELLQLGSLAMTKVSAAVMENFAEEYQVLGLPYIFTNKEHYYSVCDGAVGDDILASSEEKWLKGLCFFDAGSRSFYTNDRLIEKPEDLAGMKIRVMNSQTAIEMVEALGGSPTPMSPGELFTALQSGVVDGAENNPPTFQTSHHYEVSKYYSLDEHSSIPDVLLMSLVVWNKLTLEEKAWLKQGVTEAVKLQRELWGEAEEKALAKVIDAGAIVAYPDKAPFKERVAGLYEKYTVNDKLSKLIDAIQNDEKNKK